MRHEGLRYADSGLRVRPHGVAQQCIHGPRCMHPDRAERPTGCIDSAGYGGRSARHSTPVQDPYLKNRLSITPDRRNGTPGAYVTTYTTNGN